MIYDLDQKKRWDDYSALETATRKGLNIGREEGEEIGQKKGEARKSREVVVSLITSTNFDNKKIADLVKVTESYVQKVRQELEEENKKV